MSSNDPNASRTIQTSCQEVLQMIRWAEAKGITPEEQERRHLRTKVFIQAQLEIIRGTVADGVVVPRWMVALESTFQTLGNESHPNYLALSQGRIPIPSDHPWLRYTVPAAPAPPTQTMPPAPTITPLSQNPSNAPETPPQQPEPAISNHPPAMIQSAASVQPLAPTPALMQQPPQPSHPTSTVTTKVSAAAVRKSGTRPTPKVQNVTAAEPGAGDGSRTMAEVVHKGEKKRGKAREVPETTEKRQEKPKKRQADPEPMDVDAGEGADDDDDIQVIEPEEVRGRPKGRRGGKQKSPNNSRAVKSKARRSPSDPEVDRMPTPTSPSAEKADCLNCVKYNRKCDKQEGMACKPCQQNKQKCEHSAKNKRRGVGSNSGTADAPARSSSHRWTSVKRPSSASESRDSDENEESSIQDRPTRQRKKTKVAEESENPLDDPRQTIIVPGPRGMRFAGVVAPAIPPDYPRVIVPTARPPTARPTPNSSGERTGPAKIRPSPHANCVSKEDFNALVERVRTLEQAINTLGSVIGSGWSQVGAASISIRSTTLKYPFELQQSTGLPEDMLNPTLRSASSAPPSLPLSSVPDTTLAQRPSTPENPDGAMPTLSPTPRAAAAHEGRNRRGTHADRPSSPMAQRQPDGSSELVNSGKEGLSADDSMEGLQTSG